MVLDCCILHPGLAAGVFGMACAHGLQVEDVDLEEVAGHQLLKPIQVPSLLHFAQFHQSPSFSDLGDSYCSTIDMIYSNCSSDDIERQGYLAINIIQYNTLAILT